MLAMKQEFHRDLAAAAVEPRRNNPRVVDDQQVARTQEPRQIADDSVTERTGTNAQKPCGLARDQRPLRNQAVGKLEIEQIYTHGEGDNFGNGLVM